ncbi:hypothetical protein FB45DRAFT_1060836 [Roridomyces roridus]|uniref:DUF6534 domain-containing protein n=1 Tax=Roridomyces roridus TaxID=1738132 RepID=A0AAD7BLD1_9AGAR|nr:hypothetical protein FB45DRAFT_1060836 [Roridomyces roridus]
MAGSGVELLFGTMLIGVLLSTALFGVFAVQMLAYFQGFKKDSPWIRYFVLYIFIAEVANLIFEIGIIYEPLIIRYGSPEALVTSPRLLPADAVSIVSVSTPIQFFTAWRISVITGSFILPSLICLLSVVSFDGAVFVTSFTVIRPDFQQFQSFSDVVAVWLFSSAICDILIAVILTYSLWTRKTGSSAVDGQINRIIRLSVQTGSITAAAALLDVILFLSFPTTTAQFIPDFTLSKLYSISLLSTLNARTRGKVGDAERVPNALFKDSSFANTTFQVQTQQMPTGATNTMIPMTLPTASNPNIFGRSQPTVDFELVSPPAKSLSHTRSESLFSPTGGRTVAIGIETQSSTETLVGGSELRLAVDARKPSRDPKSRVPPLRF